MCGIIHLLLACEGKSHVTVGLESRVLAEGALRVKISRWTAMILKNIFKSRLHRTEKMLDVTHNMTPFHMASHSRQKWVESKITYRVSVIDMWDWEITAWEIEIIVRE